MKHKLFIVLIFLPVSLIMFFYIQDAVAEQDRTWSFDLSELSISDALSKISEISGIEITLEGSPIERTVTKSYRNSAIDEVLMDLFQDESFAALVHYNQELLTAIHIWVFPKSKNSYKQVNPFKNLRNQKNILSNKSSEQRNVEKVENAETRSFIEKGLNRDRMNGRVNKSKNAKKSRIISNIGINQREIIKDKGEDLSKEDTENSGSDNNRNTSTTSADPARFGGLEPPPMPPGMTLNE